MTVTFITQAQILFLLLRAPILFAPHVLPAAAAFVNDGAGTVIVPAVNVPRLSAVGKFAAHLVAPPATAVPRIADYDSILQAVRDIDIYPPERKPEEKKQNTPKKKIRR